MGRIHTMVLGFTQVVGWELIHPKVGVIHFSHDQLHITFLKYYLEDNIELERYSYKTILNIKNKACRLIKSFNIKFPTEDIGVIFTIKAKREYIRYYVPKEREI